MLFFSLYKIRELHNVILWNIFSPIWILFDGEESYFCSYFTNPFLCMRALILLSTELNFLQELKKFFLFLSLSSQNFLFLLFSRRLNIILNEISLKIFFCACLIRILWKKRCQILVITTVNPERIKCPW